MIEASKQIALLWFNPWGQHVISPKLPKTIKSNASTSFKNNCMYLLW